MKTKKSLVRQGDLFALHSNGQVCPCPFQPGVPMQDSFGVKIQMSPCTSKCPHFDLIEAKQLDRPDENPIHYVKLTCGSGADIKIEEITEAGKKVVPLIPNA